MNSETYKVSGEVSAICGKCKTETTHVIVAMVDGFPKRVECLACHAVHNFRVPKGEAPARSRAVRKDRPPVSRRRELSSEDAVDYLPGGSYKADQVLRHKTFGLGVITRVEMTRITVLFSDRQTRSLILMPKSSSSNQ